jgi:hypothetical protein
MQREEPTLTEIHQVHKFMHEFGGSYAGTHQMLNGEVLTNPRDREGLASMVSAVLEQLDLVPRDNSSGHGSGKRIYEPVKMMLCASKVRFHR